MIEDILAYNKRFVAEKGYEKYITNKYPDKKIAILSCMDTRLTALLPAALGIKNGDVKMIKNAGGHLRVGRDGSDGYCPLRLRCVPHEQRPDDRAYEGPGHQAGDD